EFRRVLFRSNKLFNAAICLGISPLGPDLLQGNKHKEALFKFRVGNDKRIRLNHQVIIRNNVQVNGACTPFGMVRRTAVFGFKTLEFCYEGMRFVGGRKGYGSVVEVACGGTNRLSDVDGGGGYGGFRKVA